MARRSPYTNGGYLCRECGQRISKQDVVKVGNGAPRCPYCNKKVSTKPRSIPPEQRSYVELKSSGE